MTEAFLVLCSLQSTLVKKNYTVIRHLSLRVTGRHIFLGIQILSFLKFIFIVVQIQLSPFPATRFPRPTHPHLPPSVPPSLALSLFPLYVFLGDLFPSFPHYLSPPSPLVTVSLFFISMFQVVFCLLVCFVD